ncbi:MAG TPA: AAA family ATPase [Candidatus Mediterraneibacter cottocaccae]|nr:AAA family ATPase [Candidatus Mediterraneibacter cottocaccae]
MTYNRLLKNDAKSKINEKNVLVTNYHGFAYISLKRMGIKVGVSDLIQSFIKTRLDVKAYDVLIIDEYQDIELELAELLKIVKDANPEMQIIAVGDMQQKIYDKTTLNVSEFINEFLGDYVLLEFTQCFRLSAELAARSGRIWNKKIIGVNNEFHVEKMKSKQVVEFLSRQEPGDVLCLGSRSGNLSKTLNKLEEDYPEIYNKNTVYASISDTDSAGATEPKKDSAIFTTYDSSKGLERKIVVVFDYTEDYWSVRIGKPLQSYEILRNIFCVAASRGKNQIIFVESDEVELSEKTLSTPVNMNLKFENMEISDMFEFKFKEDIEQCFSLLKTKKLDRKDTSIIQIKNNDGLIDLSPCIGIFQEATYFDGYSIDESIKFHIAIDEDKRFLYTDEMKAAPLEEKILFLTSLETKQNRYLNQVSVPFIREKEGKAICERLATRLSKNEVVQSACALYFSNKKEGDLLFSAFGMADAVKDDIVYELKFVLELTHQHFLQCASYVVAMEKKKGILWNTRNNSVFEVTVPNKTRFSNAVANAITKGAIRKYYKPSDKSIQMDELKIKLMNIGRKG